MRPWTSEGLTLRILTNHSRDFISNAERCVAPPARGASCLQVEEIADHRRSKAGGQAYRRALFRRYGPAKGELDKMRRWPCWHTVADLVDGRARGPSGIEQARALRNIARRQRVFRHAFNVGPCRVTARN